MSQSPARIAVIVPCYNEEAAIARVVRDFRAALPGAEIYVYDNTSTDNTPERARDRMIIGSKQECVDKLESYIKAGVSHFIFLHKPPLTSEDDIQAFAEDIIPQFRSR